MLDPADPCTAAADSPQKVLPPPLLLLPPAAPAPLELRLPFFFPIACVHCVCEDRPRLRAFCGGAQS